MRIRFFLLLLVLGSGLQTTVCAQTSNERILAQLDKVIAQKEKYRNEREATIFQMKQHLNYATDPNEQYKICGTLFNLYLHYQADSACHYLRRKIHYNSLQPQPERNIEITINRAEVAGVMGMYNEALEELHALNPHQLDSLNQRYYYFTIRACYGWMADNTADKLIKEKYLKKTGLYRDSLLEILPQSNNRQIILAEKLILEDTRTKPFRS